MDSHFDSSQEITQKFNSDVVNNNALTEKMSQICGEERIAYHSLEVGQSFGRYVIEQELGRGGMGVVYKAYDTNLKRAIALKVILDGDQKDFDRFTQESAAMAKLNHPNIIQIHDFGRHPQPHFTMEYIDGFTLAQLIRERKVQSLFLMDVMIKVCDALAHAHSLQILHRDIKPSNIMITNKGKPKVLDFGLAKVFDSGENNLSQTGDVLGTILYMSPEQLDGCATKKSDIYSVGATIYEALTYRNVHQGATYHNIAFQILERDPIPPRQLNADISPYFEAVCLKCLAKKQNKRYVNFRQLTKELTNLRNGKKIIAKRYSSFDAIKSFIRRYKVVCFSVVIVFFILSSSLAYSLKLQKVTRLERDKVRAANIKIEEEKNKTKVALNKVMDVLDYTLKSHRELQDDIKFTRLFSQIFEDIEYYGEDQDWTYLKGFVSWQNGDNQKSLVYYNQRLENSPEDANIYHDRGTLYIKLGKHKEALADYTKAIEIRPGDVNFYNNRGTLYKNMKKYSAAVADYEKAIQINPLHALAFYNRGNIYTILNRYKEAIADYSRAIRLQPKYANALVGRADLYLRSQRHKEALQDLNIAILSDSKNVKGYAVRGNLYNVLKRHKEAFSDYNKALELDPQSSRAYHGRGYIFRLWKKYQESENDYNNAIKLKPKHFGLYNDRGLLFYDQEKYNASLRDYNKAIELNPKHFMTYINRGNVYAALRRYQDALDDYNRAAERNQHAMIYHGKGVVYRELKRYGEAITSYERAISLDSRIPRFYLNLASLYYESNQPEKAAENYKKLLRLLPNTWEAHHGLYLCYTRLDKKQKAQYHFQKFQELRGQK